MAKKRNLENNIDSLFETMQEVLRDCDEQKKKIITSYKAREKRFPSEDVEDEAKMGKLQNESLKLLGEVIDKKIKVIQIHSKLVGAKKAMEGETEEEGYDNVGFSKEELAALREVAKSEADREIKYDLSDENN